MISMDVSDKWARDKYEQYTHDTELIHSSKEQNLFVTKGAYEAKFN